MVNIYSKVYFISLTLYFVLALMSSNLCRGQSAVTGIIYTSECAPNGTVCLTIKLDPFYWGAIPSNVPIIIEREDRSDNANVSNLINNQSQTFCDLKPGRYTVTVEITEDCEEVFIVSTVLTSHVIVDSLLPGPSPCSYKGLDYILPQSHAGQYSWVYAPYETHVSEIIERGYLTQSAAFLNSNSPLQTANGKYPPGLYYVSYSVGCTAYYHQLVIDCEISAVPGVVNITSPSSCTSQDGSINPRHIDVCHPNQGALTYYLINAGANRIEANVYGKFFNLPSGIYNLWVESEYGCSTFVNRYVLLPDNAIGADIETQVMGCRDSDNGEIEFTVFHDGDAYILNHNFGQNLSVINTGSEETTYRITNLAPGDHSLTVESGGNCVIPIDWVTKVSESNYQRLYGSIEDVVVCDGNGSVGLTINTGMPGTPPYTVTWDDGYVQTLDRSGKIVREFNDDSNHCAVITDHCGLASNNLCARILDRKRDFELTIKSSACDKWFATYDYDSSIGMGVINSYREVSGIRTSFSTGPISLVPNVLNKLVYIFADDCEVERVIMGPSTEPIVEDEPSCDGMNNGKVHFKFEAPQPDLVYSVTFEGLDVPLQPDLFGALRGSVGSLETPNSFQYTYTIGDCTETDYVRLAGSGTTTKFVRYESGDEPCVYDQFCQGQSLGLEATSAVEERPSDSDKPCLTNLHCRNELVGTAKRRKRVTTSALYKELLQYTLNSGIHLPGYDLNGDGSVPADWVSPSNGCARVRYCAANMRILSRWDIASGDGDAIVDVGVCKSHNCPLFNDEVCFDGSNIPLGAVEDGFLPPISSAGCTIVEISGKQLAIWHESLLQTRIEYAPGQGGRSLFDVTQDIFTKFTRVVAQSVPLAISPQGNSANQDPLFCMRVQFCRETLQVVFETDLSDIENICGEEVPPNTIPEYCIGPLYGSDMFTGCLENCCIPASIVVNCRMFDFEYDDVRGQFVFTDTPIRQYFDLCFPEEVFDLQKFPLLEDPNNTLIIPPFYESTKLQSFIPVHTYTGSTYRQKAINSFGQYNSYSECFAWQEKLDQRITQAKYSAEYLTQNDAFAVSLVEKADNQGFYIERDDAYADPLLLDVEAASAASFIAGADHVVIGVAEQNAIKLPDYYLVVNIDTLDRSINSITPPKAVSHSLATAQGQTQLWLLNAEGRISSIGFGNKEQGRAYHGPTLNNIDTIIPGLIDAASALAVAQYQDNLKVFPLISTPEINVVSEAILLVGKNPFVRLVDVDNKSFTLLVSNTESIQRQGVEDVEDLNIKNTYYVYIPINMDSDMQIEAFNFESTNLTLQNVAFSDQAGVTFAAQVAAESLARLPNYVVTNSSPFPQAVLFSKQLPLFARNDALISRTVSSLTLKTDSNKQYLVAFPNPASDLLNIKIDGIKAKDQRTYTLHIYNSQSQRVDGLSIPTMTLEFGNSQTINISSLPSGAYTLHAISDADALTPVKIVKL